jgi:hypothetical protein
MASETPGGARRRPLAWKDDRSTNKYYGSGQKSAVGGQPAGETGNAEPAPPAKRPPWRDDRSTDKYYASPKQAPTAQQAARKLGPAARLAPGPRRAPADPNAAMTVAAPGDINGVLAEVVARLNAGESPVVVYVAAGETALLRRARAALDLLVAREVVTEEQGRDVRFSYTGEPAKATTPPRPEVGPALVDPAAFLAGEAVLDDDEPAVDTAAAPAVEQELDETGALVDDEAGDFLADDDALPQDVAALPRDIETPAEAMDGAGDAPEGDA